MKKYSNFDNEMEVRNNFKNSAYPKNQMRRGNFRIARMGKITIITIIALITSVMAVDAQRNSFTDAYLKLRQPNDGEEILFEKMSRKDIRKLLTTLKPEGETEKDHQEYLRRKAMWKKTRQVGFVIDMEVEEGLLSSSQFSDLFSPYEELLSFKMEDTKMLLSGRVKKGGKVKELIALMSDTEDDVLLFAHILFKKPVAVQDYMENSEDIRQLLRVNSHAKENDNALIKINYNKNNAMTAIPELEDTLPSKLEVVQVDGKYGVRGTTAPWNRAEYLIKPIYKVKPVIYGSNPGNTYIQTFDYNGLCYLYDKFGFTIAFGHELFPVYVLENKDEVAAFIIRDDYGYSLYECPETYTLRQQNEENRISFRPHTQRRILNCQSIELTDDGQLKCVKADGSIEFIQIRK